MSSKRAGRLKSWLNRNRLGPEVSDGVAKEVRQVRAVVQNPLYNYYRHKAITNLPVFYRFALQTRSLAIRDMFAKVSSEYDFDLVDLITVIGNEPLDDLTDRKKQQLATAFESSILLTLADLLANTARNDIDAHSAVQIYEFVYTVYGEEAFLGQHKLQYVEALGELGRYDDLERFVDEFQISEIAPLQKELLNIQRVKRSSSVSDWLTSLNELYISLNMTPVQLKGNSLLPLMDRLAAGAVEPITGPMVSIIMPTFSPGPGIRTAIRGILEQSWRNLEIIVVDDASPYEFQGILREIEQLDTRVRVIHQEHNAGAYVARNAGLAVARGEYVTTHDDDDWSHPDKIAQQIEPMLKDPLIVATTSAHIRTAEDMDFRRVNMHAKFMQMNYSSLMFRRSITDEIGNWDTVNRGGDSEFYTRLIEFVGSERILGLMDKPLSFSRVWAGSLTSGELSRGFFAYSRLLYRWSFRQWHWDMAKLNQKAIRDSNKPRPYAIPTTFKAEDRQKDLGVFDVIYVTDYFRQAKFVNVVLREIEALQRAGLRVGYMHLYSPQTNRAAGIPKELFDLQVEGKVTQVGHDDNAETRLLLVYDAAIGMFVDQMESSVVTRRSLLVHHDLPSLTGTEERSSVLMGQAVQHLDRFFNTRFEIVGATQQDQDRVRQECPPSRVLPDDFVWNMHVSQAPGTVKSPHNVPILGFHSYGNRYRWPSNSEVFRDVFVSQFYDAKLYGHLTPARQNFGADILEKLELIHFEEMDEYSFLKSVDFWAYYPHHRLREQVWGPVLSAMRAGKVVILPKRLSKIYGSGAVYAEVCEIDDVVASFAEAPELYMDQAQKAQNFVEETFTRERFIDRIRTLIGSSKN